MSYPQSGFFPVMASPLDPGANFFNVGSFIPVSSSSIPTQFVASQTAMTANPTLQTVYMPLQQNTLIQVPVTTICGGAIFQTIEMVPIQTITAAVYQHRDYIQSVVNDTLKPQFQFLQATQPMLPASQIATCPTINDNLKPISHKTATEFNEIPELQNNCPTPLADAIKIKKRKSHPCQIPGCGKVYQSSSNLKVHLRYHTSEKLHFCDWPNCGKRFIRPDYLARHRVNHCKKDKKKKYSCEFCPKTFARKAHFMKHSQNHLKNGSGPSKADDNDGKATAKCNDECLQIMKIRIKTKKNDIGEVEGCKLKREGEFQNRGDKNVGFVGQCGLVIHVMEDSSSDNQ